MTNPIPTLPPTITFTVSLAKTEVHGNRTIEQNAGNSAIPDLSDAECGALGPREAPLDPELAVVVEAWSALPESVKTSILAMVRSSSS